VAPLICLSITSELLSQPISNCTVFFNSHQSDGAPHGNESRKLEVGTLGEYLRGKETPSQREARVIMYRILWFYSPAARSWNKVAAEAIHSIQSGRDHNKPDFGHKRLSEGVLLRIWAGLRGKLLFQRTSGRRIKPGNGVFLAFTRRCLGHSFQGCDHLTWRRHSNHTCSLTRGLIPTLDLSLQIDTFSRSLFWVRIRVRKMIGTLPRLH